MKMSKIFLVLLVAVAPILSFAQGDNSKGVEKFEMSIQIGAGFTWANKTPVDGVLRAPVFAWAPGAKGAKNFPASEVYGAVLRYSIDERWTVQVQGMRQRVHFSEITGEEEHHYYNAAWHTDAMAEFNIWKYAFLSNKQTRVYEFVPFISFGAGASMFGKNASYSYGRGYGHVEGYGAESYRLICMNSREKGYKYPKIEDTRAAMYIPFAVGAKLRMTENWQLKVACQYNFYLFGSDSKVDMFGTTMRPNADAEYKFVPGKREDPNATGYWNGNTKHYYVSPNENWVSGVEYDQLPEYKKSGFGQSHNLMVTLGIIFNFNPSYKDMILE